MEVFGCVHVPGGGYKEIAAADVSSLVSIITQDTVCMGGINSILG